MEVGALREVVGAHAELHEMLLRFVQVMITQASFTALSNANQSIEERLARWLLMCHDRIAGDDIPLTHEFLSIMLAVQRPSVTTALHMIEGNGFIKANRGNITILDREALVEFADGTYGAPEAEYKRLIGDFG
jgi:CRP-like cAMP-binding protein